MNSSVKHSKRLVFDGQKLTKFDLCYIMEFEFHYKSLPWTHMDSAFSYDDLKKSFIKACLILGFTSRLG